MSNYPFETFPLTKRIGIVNPIANLDARYGPWPTFNDALTGFSSLVRFVGLTVAVSGTEGITEYWYKNGITDNDLILKTVKETQFGSLSGKYESVSTTFINNSANYILDGGNTKNANLSVGTNDNFGLVLETNSLPRLTITNTGNVGVDIVNPTDKLEVNGTLKITASLPSIRTTSNRFSVNETNFVPPNDSGMVTQFSSGPYGRSIFAITHTGTNTAFFGLNAQQFTIGSEGDTDIRFKKGMVYTDSDILGSGTEIMRIKASNNSVGIGTSDPTERLTVVGNILATGLINAANVDLQVLQLQNNTPRGTIHNIVAAQYGIVTQAVSSDQIYVIELQPGQTINLFISGNHNSVKRHQVGFVNPVAYQFYIAGAGQADYFYTFKNHITKVTLTNPLTSSLPIPKLMGTGTAEVIRTDLNMGQGGLGFLSLEQGATIEQILQEDGDRLVIRNFA
jgi:hypothetical protein